MTDRIRAWLIEWLFGRERFWRFVNDLAAARAARAAIERRPTPEVQAE